jgi:hypothetical protein
MTAPEPPAPFPWRDIGLLLALVSALLVTAGWAYAEAWYGRFDLGLMGLEVPPVYFPVYGFKTLKSHWWWLLPLALGVLLAWHRYAARLPRWTWILWPPATLLLFWIAHGLGAAAARADYRDHARAQFCAYPFVRVAVEPGLALPAPLSSAPDALAGQRLRLLVQTPSLLVLIAPEAGAPPLLVPMDQVRMLRVIPVPAACRR